MKKCTSSSIDRISDLPSNITETILMFLPMRDMVRTSILSRKWRFLWVQVPELIFDRKMFRSTEDTHAENLNIVVGVLFQHHGHIRKFKLDMRSWCSFYGIDKIFQFLSRNGIQELKILMPYAYSLRTPFHAPPSSIYSCVELTHLSLKGGFVKPLKLDGFRKLVTLELLRVQLDPQVTICDCPHLRYLILHPDQLVSVLRIDCPNLESFVVGSGVLRVMIKKAPLLKVLALLKVYQFFSLKKEMKLLEFSSSFPVLENLTLSGYCVKSLARGSPNEPPTMLHNLRVLALDSINLYVKDQLPSVLRLIKSSPNLQKLEVTELGSTHPSQLQLSLEMPTSCGYSLMMKLREVKYEVRTDPRSHIDFLKFLLAISPELETLYIKPPSRHIDLSCCKTLLKFACTRRASSKADIVFIGLNLDN